MHYKCIYIFVYIFSVVRFPIMFFGDLSGQLAQVTHMNICIYIYLSIYISDYLYALYMYLN